MNTVSDTWGGMFMTRENPLFPAKSLDLRQIVYEKIKEAIVEGIIKPGEKLSEVELANSMAVSRTPVREAIRQLAKTGLVTLTPRKGAFVTVPTLEDASALYELRANLEMFAVTLVAVSPPVEDLKRFKDIFRSMDNDTPPGDYLVQDRNFHNFLYQASGNKFLSGVLLDILDMINLYRPYSVSEHNYIKALSEGHIAVIEALLAKDGERAKREMKEHIDMTRTGVEAYLQNNPAKTR